MAYLLRGFALNLFRVSPLSITGDVILSMPVCLLLIYWFRLVDC